MWQNKMLENVSERMNLSEEWEALGMSGIHSVLLFKCPSVKTNTKIIYNTGNFAILGSMSTINVIKPSGLNY